MAGSPEKTPWENPEEETPRTSSVGLQNRAQINAGQPDESPELLRWRADSLLDEMMLGAVDVSAADAGSSVDGHGYGNGHDAPDPYQPYTNTPDTNTPARDTRPEDRFGEQTDDARDYREPHGEHYHFDRQFDRDVFDHDADRGFGSELYERSNGEPGYQDEAERTRDDGRESGLASSLPPLSMPDPSLHGSAFQWREEKNGSNGNGTYPHSASGSEIDRAETNRTETNGTGDSRGGPGQNQGYTPPTIPPPRDGGRPEIRSGGLSDSTLRPSLSSDFSSAGGALLGRPITGSPAPHTPAPQVGSSPVGSGEPRVYGAGERYEQFAAEQNRQRTAPAEAPPPPETTKWEWQDFSQPSQPPGELGSATSTASAAASGDVSVVSAMSVPGGGKRRSTLLPRMTNVDADAVNQEIATLHAELMRLLPNGHEAGERARHLLEKAHDILQTDPMREAEVEYYMQQVRAIAQRVQQTRKWSDLYRDRLRLYLAAWTMLSLIVVAARVMFPIDVEAFLFGLTGGAASAALLAHYVGGLTATFAGSLGGALGALATMVQHARREYGFFDRKYGLRGLMLPIIGWLFGGLLYLVAVLIFSLMGIVPAANPIAAAIPALGAFLYGVSQESIYGTRS